MTKLIGPLQCAFARHDANALATCGRQDGAQKGNNNPATTKPVTNTNINTNANTNIKILTLTHTLTPIVIY